jgi:hypothetical protein
MAIAQTGQYNFMRMAKRGENVTMYTVIAKFIDSVTGMIFLLNCVYRPYYKWENRMMRSLPILGDSVGALMDELVRAAGYNESGLAVQQKIISEICALIHGELKRQHLTSSDDWFFTAHGEEVRSRITNTVLRSLPAQYE